MIVFFIWYLACFSHFPSKSLINQAQRFWTFGHYHNCLFWTCFHWNIYHPILNQCMIAYDNTCTLLWWLQLTPCKHLNDIPFIHWAIIIVEHRPYRVSLLMLTTPTSVLPDLVLQLILYSYRILYFSIYCRSSGITQDIYCYYNLLYNSISN